LRSLFLNGTIEGGFAVRERRDWLVTAAADEHVWVAGNTMQPFDNLERQRWQAKRTGIALFAGFGVDRPRAVSEVEVVPSRTKPRQPGNFVEHSFSSSSQIVDPSMLGRS
jgi:hypothetical protein